MLFARGLTCSPNLSGGITITTKLEPGDTVPVVFEDLEVARRELIEFALTYPTDTLDATDAAILLARTKAQLSHWRKSGRGPAYIGGRGYPVFYRAGSLLAWVPADLVPSSS